MHCEFLAWAYLNLVHRSSAIQFWLPRVCKNEWVGTSLSQPHAMCSLWNCFSSLCTCTCVCMSIVDKILCTLGRVSRLHNATCTGQCLRLSALLGIHDGLSLLKTVSS